jgi:histidinol-phosphatase
MTDIKQFLHFARSLALAAEKPILSLYQNCTAGFKADGSEVTDADREAELIMRVMIADRFPTHDVLGEEYGEAARGKSEYRWVLDPIDGTASFVLGTPMFGTLIALLHNDEPVVGVIHMPALRETIYAATKLGCWFESRGKSPVRTHVAASVDLEDAVISSTGVHHTDIVSDEESIGLSHVIKESRKFRFVGDCVQYALVCKGNLHAALDPIMHPWDIAALVPCIEESGGVVSSIEGRRAEIVFGGSLLASCSPQLHAHIIERLVPAAQRTGTAGRARRFSLRSLLA